jgi:HAE1 family hydrophobic/amphiphilic exporter-1
MLRDQGKPALEAALESAKLRFRPILMTAFAFILGVVPLMLASGAGAVSRVVMGSAVFWGMLVSTAVGVFIIPGLYVFMEKFSKGPKKAPETPPAPAHAPEGEPAAEPV